MLRRQPQLAQRVAIRSARAPCGTWPASGSSRGAACSSCRGCSAAAPRQRRSPAARSEQVLRAAASSRAPRLRGRGKARAGGPGWPCRCLHCTLHLRLRCCRTQPLSRRALASAAFFCLLVARAPQPDRAGPPIARTTAGRASERGGSGSAALAVALASREKAASARVQTPPSRVAVKTPASQRPAEGATRGSSSVQQPLQRRAKADGASCRSCELGEAWVTATAAAWPRSRCGCGCLICCPAARSDWKKARGGSIQHRRQRRRSSWSSQSGLEEAGGSETGLCAADASPS